MLRCAPAVSQNTTHKDKCLLISVLLTLSRFTFLFLQKNNSCTSLQHAASLCICNFGIANGRQKSKRSIWCVSGTRHWHAAKYKSSLSTATTNIPPPSVCLERFGQPLQTLLESFLRLKRPLSL